MTEKPDIPEGLTIDEPRDGPFCQIVQLTTSLTPEDRTRLYAPNTADDPHACLKVNLINLIGTDTNENDNWAQENLDIVASVTASPFHPATYSYSLTNQYTDPTLLHFRADGAPNGWKVELLPRKIRLSPGERMTGQAVVTPPEDATVCTRERIQVTSWVPRGDTLINVGGAVVQVDRRRPAAITLRADNERCDDRDWEILLQEARELDLEIVRKRCGRVVVQRCMDPPIAVQEIILKYVDPHAGAALTPWRAPAPVTGACRG